MKVKALTSFSGAISMSKGEERDIKNDVLLKDLMQAGYVEALEAEEKFEEREETPAEEKSEEKADEEAEVKEETPEVATSQKTSKKGVKSNESK